MVELLQQCCQEQEEARVEAADSATGSIELLFGKQCVDVDADDNNELKVKCGDGSSYTASLVVGADGMDSAVRSVLGKESESPGWLQSKAANFKVRRYKSPATGLRLKALQMPPNFEIRNSTSSFKPSSETMVVFRGVNKGTKDFASLGFLPMKDSTLVRPGNVNTRPDHVLWKMKTGAEVKDFFVKNYPRMDWDSMVSDEEWQRFATAEGTTFPYCQYSPGSAMPSPTRDTGVVLVGDACHGTSEWGVVIRVSSFPIICSNVFSSCSFHTI